MDRALHPNLARIAASYDEIIVEFRRGALTPQEARRRVLALVARDDNGLEWSIDPDTGQWQYRSLWGETVLAEPPAYGVVGLTPHALGAGGERNADARLNFYEVDRSALHAPGSLAGSTLFQPPPAPSGVTRRFVLGVAAAVVVLAGILAVIL